MPRPRFNKLTADKQEIILEAAAKVFAKHGYDGASLNQILSDAGLSKGAAYYYFDDKADLFATSVEHYYPDIVLAVEEFLVDATAANFWDVFAQIYREPFLRTYEEPWRFGVVKAAAKLPPNSPINARLQPLFEKAFGWLAAVVAQGQELGVIRTDLPTDFIYRLIGAVDDVSDNWLLEHLDALSPEEMMELLNQVVDVIRGMLTPR